MASGAASGTRSMRICVERSRGSRGSRGSAPASPLRWRAAPEIGMALPPGSAARRSRSATARSRSAARSLRSKALASTSTRLTARLALRSRPRRSDRQDAAKKRSRQSAFSAEKRRFRCSRAAGSRRMASSARSTESIDSGGKSASNSFSGFNANAAGGRDCRQADTSASDRKRCNFMDSFRRSPPRSGDAHSPCIRATASRRCATRCDGIRSTTCPRYTAAPARPLPTSAA